ncbi:MAG: N-acetylmuramoyl-L-alanine amidase [Firmicutes bacterium]|nr:N-acetylmuramoyl-L-alanine amidase [Bacillota bacterium]
MIIRKKTLISAAFVAAAVIIAAVTAISAAVYIPTQSAPCVVVDAGHGAPDGGAVGVGGVEEKDINLAIALKLREVLEGKGIKVIMTREGDSGIWDDDAGTIREKKISDMQNRLEIIKNSGADLFLSIHMNSYTNQSASGLRVFYDKQHPEGEALSELIQQSIAEVTGAYTSAVKTADEKLFLMKNPVMPSILIECGFISNAEEEKKLQDEEYQSEIAWAIAESVEKFLIGE